MSHKKFLLRYIIQQTRSDCSIRARSLHKNWDEELSKDFVGGEKFAKSIKINLIDICFHIRRFCFNN